MEQLGDFQFPEFFNDPSYFNLQPVGEVREAQIRVWKELILEYCRSKRIYIIELDQEFPLFSNPSVGGSLSRETTEVFLSALVEEGRAEWMDIISHDSCLILWRTIEEWGDYIMNFVSEHGLVGVLCTTADIRLGFDLEGSELLGINADVLERAVVLLDQKGKLCVFENAVIPRGHGVWFNGLFQILDDFIQIDVHGNAIHG